MKGLLYKDAVTLWRVAKAFLLMVAIFCLVPGVDLGPFFVVYSMLMPVTLLSLDERCHFDQLAPMLPCTDRDIVLSKYIVGWVLTLGAGLLYLFSGLFLSPALAYARSLEEPLLIWAAALVVQAVFFPLLFRFGTEKGRIFLIVMGAVCAGVAMGLIMGVLGAEELAELSLPTPAGPVTLVLAAAVNLLSIGLSVRGIKEQRK